MNVSFKASAVMPKDRPPAVVLETVAGGLRQTLILAPQEALALVATLTAAVEVIAAAPKIALPPTNLVVP